MELLKQSAILIQFLTISLSVNVIILIYCVTAVIVRFMQNRSKKHDDIEEKKIRWDDTHKKEKIPSRVIGRSAVNVVFGAISFAQGIRVMSSTNIISDPYFTFCSNAAIPLCILLSLCLFGFFYGMLYVKITQQNAHKFVKLLISISVLSTIIYSHELAIFGLIGLLMSGSLCTHEVRKLLSYNQKHKMRHYYKPVILIDILVSFICYIILPLITFFVSAISSTESFNELQNFSKVMFGIVVTFFIFHNTWVVREITYKSLAELSLVLSFKKIHREKLTKFDTHITWNSSNIVSIQSLPKKLVPFKSLCLNTGSTTNSVQTTMSYAPSDLITTGETNNACQCSEIDLNL